MEALEVREKLEKWLKGTLPDEVWKPLVGDGYVDDAILRGEWGYLHDAARNMMKGYQLGVHREPKQHVSPDQDKQVEVSHDLEDKEAQRSWAFSEYLASIASSRPYVRRFRNNILSGNLLEPTEAHRVFSSPATQVLPLQRFIELNIPLTNHRAWFGNCHLAEDVATPGLFQLSVDVNIEWDGHSHTESCRCSVRNPADFPDKPQGLRFWPDQKWQIEVPNPEGGEGVIFVWLTSLLDELRQWSERLCSSFPWQKSQAAWFLLTGETPLVRPLAIRVDPKYTNEYSRTVITIDADVWVSHRTLAQAFREVQREIIGDNHKNLSSRNLAVFRFVMQQKQKRMLPPWRKLLEKWNSLYPKWKYEDVRHFVQAYQRAEQRVMIHR
jgi:hypothetical protein